MTSLVTGALVSTLNHLHLHTQLLASVDTYSNHGHIEQHFPPDQSGSTIPTDLHALYECLYSWRCQLQGYNLVIMDWIIME